MHPAKAKCKYSFSLALVLLAIGVQVKVFLVFIWSPGLPSYTVNFTDNFLGIFKGYSQNQKTLKLLVVLAGGEEGIVIRHNLVEESSSLANHWCPLILAGRI